MWTRLHLAVISGPDPGHVIEVGAAGRGLTGGPALTIGRGDLCDHQILDPLISRTHLTVSAGMRRGRPRVLVHPAAPAARPRFLPPGARLRIGGTTLEVRTDAPPHTVRTRDLTRLLPLIAGLGFASMWLLPNSAPWPLIAGAVLGPAAMVLSGRARARRLPDPAALLRSTGHRPPPEGSPAEGWRIDTGRPAPHRPARVITLAPGDTLGLAGPGAAGMARWVTAQLLTRGARLESAAGPAPVGTTSFTLSWAGDRPVRVLAAPTPSLLPGGVTASLAAPAGHDRDVGTLWFSAFLSHAGGADLPDVAHLEDHLPPLSAIAESWQRADERLAAPIAVGPGAGGSEAGGSEPVVVDLAGDHPHAVIAGTTGAGKSELLTTWLLALALRYPPARVAMVLVDYKGGATFGPLSGLPHVLDVLTDLDHSQTVRALESLEVEIARRERLFAATGATCLPEHLARAQDPLPRLLIAVDEFRVLADEYPDVLDQLVRVAAQGRSLGIHVILATQRAGGTMTPDIRANMGIRACLRVLEEADSIDLLTVPDAAHLPPIPGRMILRDDARRTVHTLWAGPTLDDAVAACRSTAAAHPALAAVARPWAPPLPEALTEVPAADPGHIAGGLADLPAEQRLGVWQVPTDAQVVIAGEPGSGRTSAARLLAAGAARAGIAVHLITAQHAPPGPATLAHVGDPALCRALLARFDRPGPDGLIIDDVESLTGALDDALGHGAGADFVRGALKACRDHGRFAVVTTAVPAPAWVHGTHEVIFPPADPHRFALLGLPPRFAPAGRARGSGRTVPGRAIAVHAGDHTLIHLAQPPLSAALPVAPEFQLLPLPTSVNLPLAQPGITIGIGGYEGKALELPCAPGEITCIVAPPDADPARLTRLISARAATHDRPVHVVEDLPTRSSRELDDAERLLKEAHHVVVTTSPEGLSTGYHPFTVHVRHAGHVIYLGFMPRSVTGVDLGAHLSPGIPGRAALHHRGRFTPFQVDECSELPAPP